MGSNPLNMKVSLVIPALNEERQLPVLLNSIFSCRDLEIEVIVVDGKSEDGTIRVIDEARGRAPKNVTIKSLVSDKRNVSYQRNMGAEAAKNEIIIFLDADTAIHPDNLRRLVELFGAGKYSAASCRFEPLEKDWRAAAYYRILYFFHKTMEKISPYAVGSCIITRKETINRCGGFDPTIRINEDANFVSKARKCGKFKIFNIPVKVSSRRFKQHGYFRMGMQYVWIFLKRTVFGEIRDDKIKYEFGKYE